MTDQSRSPARHRLATGLEVGVAATAASGVEDVATARHRILERRRRLGGEDGDGLAGQHDEECRLQSDEPFQALVLDLALLNAA